MVKARYNGDTDELIFIDNHVYEVRKLLKYGDDKYYGVIDEVGDCSMCYTDGFTFVEGTEDDIPEVYEYDDKTHSDIRIK